MFEARAKDEFSGNSTLKVSARLRIASKERKMLRSGKNKTKSDSINSVRHKVEKLLNEKFHLKGPKNVILKIAFRIGYKVSIVSKSISI